MSELYGRCYVECPGGCSFIGLQVPGVSYCYDSVMARQWQGYKGLMQG